MLLHRLFTNVFAVRTARLVVVLALAVSAVRAHADSLPEIIWMEPVADDVVSSVAFSPNRTHLATGNWDHSLQVLKSADGALVRQWNSTTTGHDDPVNAVAFVGDDLVASAGSDMTVKVHRISTGERVYEFVAHADMVVSLAATPDGKRLISGGLDKAIMVWNLETGLRERTLTHADEVNAITVSPDGLYVAAGGYDTTAPYQSVVRLFRIADGALVRSIPVKADNGVNTLAFSPNGTQLSCGLTGNLNLAPGEDPADIQIFQVSDGALKQTLKGHQVDVLQLAYFPSGKVIASCSFDDTITYWNVETGRILERHVEDTFFIRTLAINSDGSQIAYGTDDGYLTVIEAPLFTTVSTSSPGQITLTWDGGVGPFQVQRRGSFNEPWQNLGPALQVRTLTQAISGPMGFYRVVKAP